MGVVAVYCFDDKVVLVEPSATPADSHDVNQNCIFSVFDLHDLWHFLSGMSIALFAMVLLDVRVHVWARKSGVKLMYERLVLETDDDYLSVTESEDSTA